MEGGKAPPRGCNDGEERDDEVERRIETIGTLRAEDEKLSSLSRQST